MDFNNKATADAKRQVQNMAAEMKKQKNVSFAKSTFNCAFPNTCLRTTNLRQVRDHCQSLLPQNLDEPFSDPDFKPAAESVKNPSDKAPQLPAIKWYRPDQISLRGDLLGFDRLQA